MNEEFEDEQEAQPLVEHLIELRNRLMWSLGAIIVVFIALIPFANDIYHYVSLPVSSLFEQGSKDQSLIAIDPFQVFFTPFKLAFLSAVFITMPFLIYQIWAFVAPALYKAEKRLATPLLFSSIMLFYLGVCFAYFIVFPLIFGFFNAIAPDNVNVMPDIATLLKLMTKLFFAFGIAFEIPIATVILIVAGVMSPNKLTKKRPYVIVTCFVIGMFLTPPDIFSQALLALPMWVLFEIGVMFGRLAIKGRPIEAQYAEEDSENSQQEQDNDTLTIENDKQ